ncbi:UDP-3-O-(3-hydroxymyristoyl)glucosamine N-acyltransferase [bacterium]|nr:UDP-3-O-(3-hydroxymyristoyl)glucosamine N-acyltransferase [bacterium]
MTRTLRDLAALSGGELSGDGGVIITGPAKIEDAGPGQITFVANSKYAHFLASTRASAVILPRDMEAPGSMPVLRADNPYFSFLLIVRAFFPEKPFLAPGIHPTAVVGDGVRMGDGAAVGPRVVIGNRCSVGDGTQLLAGAVLGDDVTIGKNCVIHANVSLRERVVVGDRVIIHDGTVVGSDGFGFAFEGGRYRKIPQVGTVVIEDDVEIGANTAIDRATLGETRIRAGAKLDNLIQIAHNCVVGEHTAIAAQAGLSGSTVIGRGVRIGGQAGFAGHLQVGDGAAVGAQAGVDKSVPEGIMVSGAPARPHREEMRAAAAVRQLPNWMKEIRRHIRQLQSKEKESESTC